MMDEMCKYIELLTKFPYHDIKVAPIISTKLYSGSTIHQEISIVPMGKNWLENHNFE